MMDSQAHHQLTTWSRQQFACHGLCHAHEGTGLRVSAPLSSASCGNHNNCSVFLFQADTTQYGACNCMTVFLYYTLPITINHMSVKQHILSCDGCCKRLYDSLHSPFHVLLSDCSVQVPSRIESWPAALHLYMFVAARLKLERKPLIK